MSRRKELLSLAEKHREQDMLIRGAYGQLNGSFRGCSIGCFAHEIHPDFDGDNYSSPHKIVADEFNYPEWLAHLQDRVFEGLPEDEAIDWHVQLATVLSKLPDDFDWKIALHKVHISILEIALPSTGSAIEAVQAAINLHKQEIESGDVEPAAADRSAARSAAAAESVAAATAAARSAAWSVAAATASAESVAWSADRSAAAAAAAARSAVAAAAAAESESAAAAAARSAAYQEIRNAVLGVLIS